MFSDLSRENPKTTDYPIQDSRLPFSEYIARTREIIKERRIDLKGANANTILNANSPYELRPSQIKCGALLIHGLLDCPFTLQELGSKLVSENVLCRSILLPGHGTIPSDLLYISHQEWIQAVLYGIESLKQEVDEIYLVGYSTGATLSVYHALKDAKIKGVILLSPAIRIKAPVDIAVAWHRFTRYFTRENKLWVYKEKETDYTKYHSITFNAVYQVAELTRIIREMNRENALQCPVYMAISREDETVSGQKAIEFFQELHNPKNRLLLYSGSPLNYSDTRINVRLFEYKEPTIISHCSHAALPFSPDNIHYGRNGNYPFASRDGKKNVIYGAYNRIEEQCNYIAYKMRLTNLLYKELTYNPDFNFLAEDITRFIVG